MASPLIICDNCGARWRLPENFASAQSKCRQCGSAIDVARQRDAGDGAPAAARPAAGARPAVDRSKEAPRTLERPVERPAAAAGAPARTGRERDEPRRRRGEREPAAKKSRLPFVIAGVVVLAVVIAIVALR